MLNFSFCFLLIAMHSEVLQDHPKFFCTSEFSSADFAEAVNHYIAVGEDAAIRELLELAKADESHANRVCWLCMVLFQPQKEKNLVHLQWTNPDLPILSMSRTDWPLYPVALSGKTYFVIGQRQGHSTGTRLPYSNHIEKFRQEGHFRTEPISIPTREQALADAQALRKGDAWTKIKWTDGDGGRWYEMNEESIWQKIQSQAENIPHLPDQRNPP